MTRVAASTIRAIVPARPGYGANSSLRNSRNQVRAWGDSYRLCAAVAIFNLRESSRWLTHQFETNQKAGWIRAHERGILRPNGPSLEFLGRPGDRVVRCQQRPGPVSRRNLRCQLRLKNASRASTAHKPQRAFQV